MSAPTASFRPATTRTAPDRMEVGLGIRFARFVLIGLTVLVLTALIVIPAGNVFKEAFSRGWEAYVRTFYVQSQDTTGMDRRERRVYLSAYAQAQKTRDAIALTVSIAAIVIPLNLLFGIAAAWAVSKFRFRGRTLLVSLIDLPFAVSPVVAGLIFVLLFGRLGFFGDFGTQLHWPAPLSMEWRGFGDSYWPIGFGRWYQGIIFTPIAIVLASAFVTFPFIARALIPLMETQGTDQEQAALTLGASGRRTFFRVTLPQIKWALLYGVILTMARCFGEFGAVSVVSGNTDANDTMPLRIEKLWQEYNTQAAFAVASLLTAVAIVTLLVKIIIENRTAKLMRDGESEAGTP
ncbi:MAG TPA: ABC transporter permease subunit [Tepidisphaeraceae bacterium]|nr:ABC transporter permease subunit [Tepidisphaeraceae bacterium]